MIKQLSAQTRLLLAECRALAMCGKLQTAINKLDEARKSYDVVSSSKTDFQVEIECAAISLLKIELLHLDRRDKEAYEFLRLEILTRTSFLPKEIELIILQNKSEIENSLWMFDGLKQLNRSFDEREIIGLKLWNPETIVYAYEYAANGKHYESLPAFWLELETTYRQGSWFFYRQAARRMSLEWLQLGFAHFAAYQAVIAQDDKSIKNISTLLLAWRDLNRIRLTITKILITANLKRHAEIASEFFKTISDAIPDEQLDEVINWLIDRCNLVPEDRNDLSLSISVWETIVALRHRLRKEQAKRVVEIATSHSLWDKPTQLRRHLIKAVNASIPNLASKDLTYVARKAIPLATTRQEQVDYDDALDLLIHLAERSKNAKKIIESTLYTKSYVENWQLLEAAPIFNKGISASDANRMASEISNDLHLQVQRLKPEDSVVPLMHSFGHASVYDGDENIIISLYSFLPLNALLEYRKVLSPCAIKQLVDALLEMLCETENTPANKVGLLNGIIKLADSLTAELAQVIFEKLLPFATGEEKHLPIVMQSFGDPTNPLNPNKFNIQTLEDVQSHALLALAKIEENQPNLYGKRLTIILEKAMTDIQDLIREYAFLSVRKISILGDAAINNLLMGTRDQNAFVAAQAYLALAENDHLKFTDVEWLTLVHSLALSFNSADSIVRRDAAYVIVKRESQWKRTIVAEKMNELKTAFANDICYSVRVTALQNNSKKKVNKAKEQNKAL